MKIILCILILSISIRIFANEKPQIRFLSNVEISQKAYLTIADIVEVTNGNREIIEKLEKINLPFEDHDYELSQLQIREALRQFSNVQINKVVNPIWIIPQKIQLKMSGSIISKMELSRRIRQYLQLSCNDCEYEVNISNVPVLKSPHWKVNYKDIIDQSQFLISVDEAHSSQLKWISGLIKKFKVIPVANRMIKHGEKLTQDMLTEKRIDISQSKDAPLDIEKISGRLLNRQINIGQPIWTADLQKQLTVQRGQLIKAMVGNDSIEVSLQVQAEDSGQVGDMIKVKNLANSKILSAKITSENQVEIK